MIFLVSGGVIVFMLYIFIDFRENSVNKYAMQKVNKQIIGSAIGGEEDTRFLALGKKIMALTEKIDIMSESIVNKPAAADINVNKDNENIVEIITKIAFLAKKIDTVEQYLQSLKNVGNGDNLKIIELLNSIKSTIDLNDNNSSDGGDGAKIIELLETIKGVVVESDNYLYVIKEDIIDEIKKLQESSGITSQDDDNYNDNYDDNYNDDASQPIDDDYKDDASPLPVADSNIDPVVPVKSNYIEPVASVDDDNTFVDDDYVEGESYEEESGIKEEEYEEIEERNDVANDLDFLEEGDKAIVQDIVNNDIQNTQTNNNIDYLELSEDIINQSGDDGIFADNGGIDELSIPTDIPPLSFDSFLQDSGIKVGQNDGASDELKEKLKDLKVKINGEE
jgi:hypothetical protein